MIKHSISNEIIPEEQWGDIGGYYTLTNDELEEWRHNQTREQRKLAYWVKTVARGKPLLTLGTNPVLNATEAH